VVNQEPIEIRRKPLSKRLFNYLLKNNSASALRRRVRPARGFPFALSHRKNCCAISDLGSPALSILTSVELAKLPAPIL
jgi:hypothetical protein